MTDQQPDPWRCGTCGTHHPIQPLARACEARHEQEAASDE